MVEVKVSSSEISFSFDKVVGKSIKIIFVPQGTGATKELFQLHLKS